MKKFFGAQSTLEFIMLLILVIAGIFIMGPYVVRAVNAYMRSWEASVEQSKHSMVQIPPWEIDPNQLMPCSLVNCSGYDGDNCTAGINRKNCCVWVRKYFDQNYPNPGGPGTCQLVLTAEGCASKSSAQLPGAGCCNIAHNAGHHNHLCCYNGASGIFNSGPGAGGEYCEDKCDCNMASPNPCANCNAGTCNQVCNTNENYSCPDCACGNGHCEWMETAANCPADCATGCNYSNCVNYNTNESGCVSQGNDSQGNKCCVFVKKSKCGGSSCSTPDGTSCLPRANALNACRGLAPGSVLWITGSQKCANKLSCQMNDPNNTGWKTCKPTTSPPTCNNSGCGFAN